MWSISRPIVELFDYVIPLGIARASGALERKKRVGSATLYLYQTVSLIKLVAPTASAVGERSSGRKLVKRIIREGCVGSDGFGAATPGPQQRRWRFSISCSDDKRDSAG
jgi:hypothetical protein